jgi:hypothetical protein
VNTARPKKLYCYVDESGQDTKGNLYIVSIEGQSAMKDLFEKAIEMGVVKLLPPGKKMPP